MSTSTEKTDADLDREWQNSRRATSPRPQSTMAISFELALNDLFKIDSSIADLDAAVDQKKKAVSSQTSELEALEARLRATEERLRAMSLAQNTSKRSNPRPRHTHEIFEGQKSPLANESRPKSSTSNRPKSRKEEEHQRRGLPPTPGQSEGETEESSEESEEEEEVAQRKK